MVLIVVRRPQTGCPVRGAQAHFLDAGNVHVLRHAPGARDPIIGRPTILGAEERGSIAAHQPVQDVAVLDVERGDAVEILVPDPLVRRRGRDGGRVGASAEFRHARDYERSGIRAEDSVALVLENRGQLRRVRDLAKVPDRGQRHARVRLPIVPCRLIERSLRGRPRGGQVAVILQVGSRLRLLIVAKCPLGLEPRV